MKNKMALFICVTKPLELWGFLFVVLFCLLFYSVVEFKATF